MRPRQVACFGLLVVGAVAGAAAPATGPAPRYAGQYVFNGGEPAATSWTTLLPSGDYVIVYFGGMQQGTWRVLPGGQLEMREWQDSLADFVVYGRYRAGLADTVRMQFAGLEGGYVYLGFAAAGPQGLTVQRAFTSGANCYPYPHVVQRLRSTVPALSLFAQVSRRAGDARVPPEPALYSYALDKKYNDYQIFRNGATGAPRDYFTGRLQNGQLWLVRNAHATTGGDNYGHWGALSAKAQREAEQLIADARTPPPPEIDLKAQPRDSLATLRYFMISGTTHSLRQVPVSLDSRPVFVAHCK